MTFSDAPESHSGRTPWVAPFSACAHLQPHNLLRWVLRACLKDEDWAFLERAFCSGLEPGLPKYRAELCGHSSVQDVCLCVRKMPTCPLCAEL